MEAVADMRLQMKEDRQLTTETRCCPQAEVVGTAVICPIDHPPGYEEFLATKEIVDPPSGRAPRELHESLFPFQAAITRWAIRRGRAAIFADTGLGKTRMQIEWARHFGPRTLIVAPLGVTQQTVEEAAKMDVAIEYATSQPTSNGIYITNYERLQSFDALAWDGIVLDESSIIKDIASKTRERLIREWNPVPARLCCTATPAPNDIAELANHAEFLGVMTRPEMLATWFLHDEGATGWRLKRHAESDFYKWLASWAMYVRRPSDIGFDDDGFDLPPLEITEQRVMVDWKPQNGMLFPQLAGGIQGRHAARRASLDARIEKSVDIIKERGGQWVVWCGLNDEATKIADALGDRAVNVEGKDAAHVKIERETAWRSGKVDVLVTKPTIFGYGMNWQHCHQMLFLGLGDSFEQYYQAIRRCWRFGQQRPVNAEIVLSDAEGRIADNVKRKEKDHERAASGVIAHVKDIERIALETEAVTDDKPYMTDIAEGEGWKLYLGDCVEQLRDIEDASIGLSVHSPPFAQLYVYSASPRDMGNSKGYGNFFSHYRYAVQEIKRVTMPGRRACVHVQQVSKTKNTHGVIGWFDFRGDVIRLYESEGWIYDGEVCIDKDPQAQAIRTKSKALMFVQKNKDSSWSRPAMADYILLFRAPGENPEPVKTDITNEDWILWARPIWYGIREAETLQAPPKANDEKHIAPLQLETIERCVRLWSNKGDLVLDPMAGIGSTGYVCLQHDRRFVGVELKPEYWQTAVRNLEVATSQGRLL